MKQQLRSAVYDEELRLEAYRFQGAVPPFPSHFHPCYVLGFVARGQRAFSCRSQPRSIRQGDILLLGPGESHACLPCGGTLDYRGFHIPAEVMEKLAEELTGRPEPPGFSQAVFSDRDAAGLLRLLHCMVMDGSRELQKEETLLALVSLLIQRYGRSFPFRAPECRAELALACSFLEENFARRIRLEEVCRAAGLSKSTLLRAFTRDKGVTPYRYLESIRLGAAKRLLEQGVPPAEAALRTGFSDQSHFTNYFTRFLGLTPGACREMFSNKEAH